MPALLIVAKYWRQILAALFLVLWVLAVLWVLSILKERDRLKQDNATLSAQLESAAKMQEMQNRITEAIGKINLRSNINVNRIESEPAPKFVDARPIPFIPGGLPQNVYSSAGAPGGAAPRPPEGGPLPAGEP